MSHKRPSPYSLAELARQNEVAATASSVATPNSQAIASAAPSAPVSPPTQALPTTEVESDAAQLQRTAAAAGAADAAATAPAQQTQQQQQHQQQAESDAYPANKRRRSQPNAPKILPRDYAIVDPTDLVILISSMLMELIRFNDKIPLRDGRLTRFHSRTPPNIGVQQYLERLTVHATLSAPVLLSMVYLIDRICAMYPSFTISSLTVHRFLICAATVASKGLSDSFWSNKTYAKVGGISMDELALLELELLFKVDWRIVPRPEVLVDYYLSLVERCEGYALEKSSGRGLRDGLHGQDSGDEESSSSSTNGEDDDSGVSGGDDDSSNGASSARPSLEWEYGRTSRPLRGSGG
ncbi:hypothetical protein KEM52_006508 [Ascosphaera acerosa]|nr:hypothetical protein KEM52_006508 [Ascosphaera acerosa]